MARFEDAIDFVLEHEGGLADNPADPGGLTRYGISLRWLRSREAAGDIDGDGDVDEDDIRALTVEDAKRLYRTYFWTPRLDHIKRQCIATKYFDTIVNTGPKRATLILQSAIAWFDQDIKVDGVFGPVTLAKVNGVAARGALNLYRAMQSEQAGFYVDLVNARRTREVFLLGWMNRALS